MGMIEVFDRLSLGLLMGISLRIHEESRGMKNMKSVKRYEEGEGEAYASYSCRCWAC